MVDLRAKPFYLNDEQIKWVEDTFSSLTIEDKIKQLFVLLKAIPGYDENLLKIHSEFGGFRWQNQDMNGAYKQNIALQRMSKIPQVIAVNCDDGGNGAAPNGTFVATAVECGAGNVANNAYRVGYVAGKEASAVGANWMFNPVCDIYFNWRNTIVNTRACSSDPMKVLTYARNYIKGIKDANLNMACTAKHFPGDGVEEIDQHLALGVNDLSVEDWENSYGMVYRSLINEGLESIMVGHIALPEMSRKLVPGIEDKDIKPATLSKELITDLLRKDMGFNGVIITDATHMVGFSASEKRSNALPNAIMAGCDMILFANDANEDLSYMTNALNEGRLTEERLNEAVTRILALKAHLNLYKGNIAIPKEDNLKTIGCLEHKAYTKEVAEETITLVKDTRKYLPIDVNRQKRCYLVYVGSTPASKGYQGDKTKELLVNELRNVGLDVDVCPNFYDLEVENGVNYMNAIKMMTPGSREEFIKNHDFVLVVVNVKGFAQENNVRLRWSCSHSRELPWYNEELPTIGMSLNYTNHLIDLPQLHTFINAYSSDPINIKAAVEKLVGKSEFAGKAEENVFCDRWNTRL